MKYLRKFLFPIGFLYGLITSLRNLTYQWRFLKVHRVSVPVISVGNISVGGTGKTPMAEYLISKLEEMGSHPAYLSRGYGRSTRGFLWVDPRAKRGISFGDEAFQVASKFPHLPVAVCENRVEGVRQMLLERPRSFDVLVLDDAFQHLRIHRDLNLVMIDFNRPPWRDLMLPAGDLREPLSGLKRTDFYVFTKFNDLRHAIELASRFTSGTPSAFFELQLHCPVPFFKGEAPEAPSSIYAFSGLGNNQFFFSQLKRLYQTEIHSFAFPDHHLYQSSDLQKIADHVQRHPENSTNFGDALILTSEKDYYRLRGQTWLRAFEELPLFYLPARMVPLDGETALEEHLTRVVNRNQMINKKPNYGETD